MSVLFGLFSDLHASLPGAPTRGHSDRTVRDMEQGMSRFVRAGADFAVSLGDVLHRSETDELQYDHLRDTVRRWNGFGLPVHLVFGNHEFQQLGLDAVLGIMQTPRAFYSFDLKGFRFILLDTCYRPDGAHYENDDFDWTEGIIPDDQLRWLKTRLADKMPTVIFTHTNLYLDPSLEGWEHYLVKNYSEVLELLADSGCVRAVFQGHRHSHHFTKHRGISFINVPAPIMSESYTENDFPLVELSEGRVIYNGRDLG